MRAGKKNTLATCLTELKDQNHFHGNVPILGLASKAVYSSQNIVFRIFFLSLEFMMSSCHSYQIRLFPSFVSKKENKWIDFVDTKPLTKTKKNKTG